MRHIDRVAVASSQAMASFATRYIAQRQPALLQGAAKTWQPHVVWNGLLRRFGDLPVTLSVSRADGCFGRVDENCVEFAAQRSVRCCLGCVSLGVRLTGRGTS